MSAPFISLAELAQRFQRLGSLLSCHEDLWRPTPFHVPRPDWCRRYPAYTEHLLTLDERTIAELAADNQALIALAGRFVPRLAELAGLIVLPRVAAPHVPVDARLAGHVPGRKQAQIEAFAGSVGEPAAPVLEWCAGKGHLGRLIGHRWQRAVLSLERDATLCAEGGRLARRAGVAQDFVTADALRPDSMRHLAGRHAIALHACGDLHRALLHGVAERAVPALDLAPCCYYRTAAKQYVPLNPDANLRLSRDELHLAVTETATAGARDRRQRDQAMAWKLAFLEWRAERDIPRERTFKPVPGPCYGHGFAGWLGRLCDREGLQAPRPDEAPAWEARGWNRQREVLRLDLARLAFRRPLEIWLLLDRALFLARRGYAVGLAEFCDRRTTPRNVLISARRSGGTIMATPTEPGP